MTVAVYVIANGCVFLSVFFCFICVIVCLFVGIFCTLHCRTFPLSRAIVCCSVCSMYVQVTHSTLLFSFGLAHTHRLFHCYVCVYLYVRVCCRRRAGPTVWRALWTVSTCCKTRHRCWLPLDLANTTTCLSWLSAYSY